MGNGEIRIPGEQTNTLLLTNQATRRAGASERLPGTWSTWVGSETFGKGQRGIEQEAGSGKVWPRGEVAWRSRWASPDRGVLQVELRWLNGKAANSYCG